MYALEYASSAESTLRRLDKPIARQIAIKLKWLADNAETAKHKGLSGNLSGLFKLRIGDYRAIYTINHQERLLLVREIGHRREIYDE